MMLNLYDLKEGDIVAYTNQWYSTGWSVGYYIWQQATVERATETQLTVKGEKFLRRNGRQVGSANSYSRSASQIQVWTDEIEGEIKKTQAAIKEHELRQELLRKVNNVNFRELTTAKLEAIVKVLEAASE